MAAALSSRLHHLLEKSPPLTKRILSALKNPCLLHSPNSERRIFSQKPSETPYTNNNANKVKNFPTHLDPWFFSPICPSAVYCYRILASGSGSDGGKEEESGMWADSVKKKRKKKMNKHKYKKLMKRTRKQT